MFIWYSWFYAFVESMVGWVGHLGKGEKYFFMKLENNIWKRWWLGVSYFNPVLPLYRNHPIDFLQKSVNWFLYNGNTDLNGKVDSWLR